MVSYTMALERYDRHEPMIRDREFDIRPSGFAANRDNIARFIDYSADQGLISAAYAPERLFHASVLDT